MYLYCHIVSLDFLYIEVIESLQCYFGYPLCLYIQIVSLYFLYIKVIESLYYFCFFRHPSSHLVFSHFKEKYLSYLYQIWYGCLLGY